LYSLEAIYHLRKTPFLISLGVGVLLGIMQMSPFTLLFMQNDTYRWDQTIWELTASEEDILLAGLPRDCVIEERHLNCSEPYEYQVNDEVAVKFNQGGDGLVNGLVFNEESFNFVQQGHHYSLRYDSLDGINFGELKQKDDGYEVLFTSVAQALRGHLILPTVLNVYQTGIISFFIYTFVVAAISMLFKFGHASFIPFKEVFNIMIYASCLPIFISIIVGIFITPAFTTIIINMGTPLVAYGVYRRKLIPSLQKQV